MANSNSNKQFNCCFKDARITLSTECALLKLSKISGMNKTRENNNNNRSNMIKKTKRRTTKTATINVHPLINLGAVY